MHARGSPLVHARSQATVASPDQGSTAIRSFETLAQFALAMMAYATQHSTRWSFALPSSTDDTPSEAGLNKLWSMSEPIGSFLKLAAQWAALHRVDLMVTHVAEKKNTWADELSRGGHRGFAHRPHDRHKFPLARLAQPAGSVILHPQEAAWADKVLAAQHPA